MVCIDDSGIVVSLDNCFKIVVYDLIGRNIVETIELKNGFNIDILEQYIDKHDPYLFFTCSSSVELVNAVEETGVHVYVVKCPVKYIDLIDSI